MALQPQFLEELRRRLSIFDVIGRRVRLVRRGHQATGLCPFHREKSPSFHVYDGPDEPHYHCFGCGAHGDVITFVMQTEGLQFRDAVERLAAEAGLEIPRDSPEAKERAERLGTLAGIMELACKFFEAQLGGSAGRAGRDYLFGRGLTEETMQRFRLGFAPEGSSPLKAKLAKEGVPEALSLEAGLLKKSDEDGHVFDFFRKRVMFPILDARGRVIAFGARALGDEKPKYLNSPETPLFQKGRSLYNLNHAQKPARDKQEILVVEGYMDVIALSEAGFPQTVAPLGTALTEDHIKLLWRLAPEPILCFDGDNAGEQAAARAVERVLPILKPGFSLRFAWLPAGQDPDDLVRGRGQGQGQSGLRQLIDRAEPLVDMLWRRVQAGRGLDTPERRSGFRRDLQAAIGRIADRDVQEDYRREVAGRLEDAFSRKGTGSGTRGDGLRLGPSPGRGLAFRSPVLGGEAAKRGTAGIRRLPYEVMLAVLVNHPELLHRHAEALGLIAIPDPRLDKLKEALLDLATRQPDLDSASLKNQLKLQDFSPVIEGLAEPSGLVGFAHVSAGIAQAEAGLLHVMAILREPEIEAEFQAAAKALEVDMSQENLDRFQTARQQKLEVESRRRDIDRDAFDGFLQSS
jgi:DNA primase